MSNTNEQNYEQLNYIYEEHKTLFITNTRIHPLF